MDRYTVLEPCRIPGHGRVDKGAELELSTHAARYYVLRRKLQRIDPERPAPAKRARRQAAKTD